MGTESLEQQKNKLEGLLQSFQEQGPHDVMHVQISSLEGQWETDSSAHKMKLEGGILSFAVVSATGIHEKYESVDGSGTRFKNTITGEECRVSISFG